MHYLLIVILSLGDNIAAKCCMIDHDLDMII